MSPTSCKTSLLYETNEEQKLTILGCEQVDKTGQELQRHLKGPIYVFSADLSRASQTTEVLTNNLMQDITITYNDIL